MKKNIIWLIALALSATVHGQNVTGMVKSNEGEGIPFASIAVLNSTKGTQADELGYFNLDLKPGKYQLSFSAVGYATRIENLTVQKGQEASLTVNLPPSIKSLDQVVITAEKKETELQRTPVAVSVLAAKDLEEYRIWSFSDMSALAPSLQTVEHGGSTSSLFMNIRGVMGLHSQTAVATYIDGVYQFESFSVPMTFNNVERIEILRGPQGTLYGRNAFGGVVNIVTKKPDNNAEGTVEIGLGNFGQQRYSASYRTPLAKNKLFLGVSGLFDQRSGVYTNTITDDDFDRPQSISTGLNLVYIASPKWDFALNMRYERNEDQGSYPWVTSDSLLFANPYTVARNSPNIERRHNYNASVKATYSGDHVNFHAISAYQRYERGFPELLDVDFTGADLRKVQNDWDIGTFTQEFRVSSAQNKSSVLAWTIGTFGWLAPDGSNENATFRTPEGGGFTTRRNSEFNNRGIAFFGQLTYQLTDKLSFTPGLRYDYEVRELAQERITIQPDGEVSSNQPLTDFETSFDAFTPKVNLAYQFNTATMVYAQYARGFRAGGLNAFAPDADDIPFDPEYSDNYEIGVKSTFFNNKLRLNVISFYLQQRDQQVNVIEDAFFLTRNTGDMNNLGLELELEALPFPNLRIQWTGSLSRAEYENLVVFSNGENRDFSGNKPLFNPPVASFLAAQYTKPLGKSIAVFVRGEHRYTGEHYFNFDNVVRQSPYHLYNARLGMSYRNYEVAFWGRNLSDVKYRTWATRVFLLSQPRMWGVTLKVNFRSMS